MTEEWRKHERLQQVIEQSWCPFFGKSMAGKLGEPAKELRVRSDSERGKVEWVDGGRCRGEIGDGELG